MIRLEIVGTPAAKGSSRAMLVGGKPRVIASGSTANQRAQKSWGASVSDAIERARPSLGAAALDCAIVTAVVYRLPPLRAHFDDYGIKSDAPLVARTGKDLEKLARSTHDHVTAAGGVWTDDARVAIAHAARLHALPGGWQGALMLIGPYEERDQVLRAWIEIVEAMQHGLVAAIIQAGAARALGRASKRRAPKRLSRAQAENVLALPDVAPSPGVEDFG